MKKYIEIHPWKILEKGFHPEYSEVSESLFSLGNGFMGHRGNFEENFSGKSLQGSYFGGIYYPDKTRVGWWKIGYPEYFAKVLNAVNWIGMNIRIGDEVLDLNTGELLAFSRELDMKEGTLRRSFQWRSPSGKEIACSFERFCSLDDREAGAIMLTVRVLNEPERITISPYLDFNVHNRDANYDEQFWSGFEAELKGEYAYVSAATQKTNFHIGSAMRWDCTGGKPIHRESEENEALCKVHLHFECQPGQEVTIVKYVCNQSSLYHDVARIKDQVITKSGNLLKSGYQELRRKHIQSWEKFWDTGDILIEGDDEAQQAIRFNIFQLWQTYQGQDPRLNIGPKGFTGEKYGGSTYWDTEAFCLPFYLGTCSHEVGKNLLLYRHGHLDKAIENAAKLGFHSGAALYPMVTMNGEECHNEWEITFEEIHRNGAIAYAIFNYIRYTGDRQYLLEAGLDVLVAISRFWSQRVNWSEPKRQFVILGVTGPNEYENNVNNNWYTNFIARWCLQYTLECLEWAKDEDPSWYAQRRDTIRLKDDETARWREVIDHLYLPEDKELGIFLQQDQYLEKEQMMADNLDPSVRPLHQNWSWDRILRSCFIKQADVLQGIYFFEEQFDTETIKRNFLFYEPRTVHESSLSPCIHSILAARLGMQDKAYGMYLRTARLDLEDINNDTEDGLHITSMAGTWLAIVKGFAGLKVSDGLLHLDPLLPPHWRRMRFRLYFKDVPLLFDIKSEGIEIENPSDIPITIYFRGREFKLPKPGSMHLENQPLPQITIK